MQRLFLLIALFSALLAGPVWAAPTLDDRFQLRAETLAGGDVRLSWTIADGAYLYRDHVKVAAGTPPATLPATTSPGEMKDDPGFGRVEIWRAKGEAVVSAAALAAAGSPRELSVTYQGCEEDSICYPPVTRTLALAAVPVADASATPPPTPRPDPAAQSAAPAASAQPAAAPAASPEITVAADTGVVSNLAARGGAAWVLLAFAGFGLLLAFTPCVFPMYPILAGLLAREGDGLSPRRGLALSSAYVAAMATAFAALGAVAAWSGANLQMVLQSPWAIGLLSAVFVLLAVSMFGAFELQLPQAWVNRFSRSVHDRRPSLGSAAALGFTSALIVGPCVTAPLAGALLYIAQTGDLALGAGALFALGLGKGAPLVAMGVLGPRALPRAGRWMTRVKQLFGAMFLATALWLASRILPPPLTLALAGALLIGLAVALGAVPRPAEATGPMARAARAAGLVAGVWGGLLLIGAASGAENPLKPLEALAGPRAAPAVDDAVTFATARSLPEVEREVSQAVAGGQPSLVYFTADWCLSCDVIERRVFDDPAVRAELDDVRLIKADVTANDEDAQAMLRRFAAAGPPTMVFLDRQAAEAGGARQVGELSARDFLESLTAVQETRP